MLRVAAPAKINLCLHVGGRRADGYHALESLVCFAEIGDMLTFAPAQTLSLSVEGPFAAGLAKHDENLVLRAAEALAASVKTQKGAAITLTKNLPVASGIGGGSADAAAALRGLVQLWKADVGDSILNEIGLSLGSDVPVCLKSAPAIMSSRGEVLKPAPALPRAAMLLVNPGVSVSTAEVFAALGRSETDTIIPLPSLPAQGWATARELAQGLDAARNDMEAPARAIAPVIGEVLEALRETDPLLARMCGSGATCYALYESGDAAEGAARKLSAAHPGWWISATRIAD